MRLIRSGSTLSPILLYMFAFSGGQQGVCGCVRVRPAAKRAGAFRGKYSPNLNNGHNLFYQSNRSSQY